MSTTHGAHSGSSTSGDETQVHPRVTGDRSAQDGSSGSAQEGPSASAQEGPSASAQDRPAGSAEERGGEPAEVSPTAAKMRDGAMARTAQGRDLAARKARALRGATAGLAAGSAAGATAGRGAPPRAPSTARPASSTASSTARGSRPAPRRGGPRRVRLTAQRIDPWSVLKISFLVSVALGIAGVVMVALLWTVLSGMNVFSTISDFFVQVTSGESGGPSFDLMDYFGFGRVVSLAAVLGVLNVFLLTALATLTAFLYNICAALVGGTQVTLSDE